MKLYANIQEVKKRLGNDGSLLTLRKPLSPKIDDAECRAEYEKLLCEFNELKKLEVDDLACLYVREDFREKTPSPDGNGFVIDISESWKGEPKRLVIVTEDGTIIEKEKVLVETDAYNTRVGEYSLRRHQYNEKFAGRIETVDDVVARIKELQPKIELARKKYTEETDKLHASELWNKDATSMTDEERENHRVAVQAELDKLHLGSYSVMMSFINELRDEEQKFSVIQYAWDTISE